MNCANALQYLEVLLPYGCFLVVWASIFHVWRRLVLNSREVLQLQVEFEHLLGITYASHGVQRNGGDSNQEVIRRVIDGTARRLREMHPAK